MLPGLFLERVFSDGGGNRLGYALEVRIGRGADHDEGGIAFLPGDEADIVAHAFHQLRAVLDRIALQETDGEDLVFGVAV